MTAPPLASSFLQDPSFRYVLYIIAFSLFIQGLRGLAGPTTAVRGNRIAAVGMAIAIVATLLAPLEGNWGLIALGSRALGAAVGVRRAAGADDRDAACTRRPTASAAAVFLISWAEFRLTSALTATFHDLLAVRGDRRSVSFWGSNTPRQAPETHPGRPITLGGPADRQPACSCCAAGAIDTLPGPLQRSSPESRFAPRCSATRSLPIEADMPVWDLDGNAFTGPAAATGIAGERILP
jgi:NAD(P) transhydrogenase subunit beta